MNGSALVYTAVAASANVIGAAAVVSRSQWSVRALENMVALSAGFMISVALLDLTPDAIRLHGESGLLGALLTLPVPLLGQYGLPLAAGVTFHVGASNLVPEFQGKSGWRLPISFFLGCASYYLARRLMGI